MKKVLVAVLTLSVALILTMSADAKNKKQIKASPCVQKCKVENFQCRKVAKKGPVKERNKKFTQCKNNRQECIKKCKTEESKTNSKTNSKTKTSDK